MCIKSTGKYWKEVWLQSQNYKYLGGTKDETFSVVGSVDSLHGCGVLRADHSIPHRDVHYPVVSQHLGFYAHRSNSIWGQPILTLAMILLAVPFTFSAPRSPGMGSRLAVGVIVGLLTWISYQIMVNLGLLFALSAPVTALGLPIAFVLVALSLVYWYDRQH